MENFFEKSSKFLSLSELFILFPLLSSNNILSASVTQLYWKRLRDVINTDSIPHQSEEGGLPTIIDKILLPSLTPYILAIFRFILPSSNSTPNSISTPSPLQVNSTPPRVELELCPIFGLHHIDSSSLHIDSSSTHHITFLNYKTTSSSPSSSHIQLRRSTWHIKVSYIQSPVAKMVAQKLDLWLAITTFKMT